MSNIEFKPFRETKVCSDCLNSDVCKKQHDIEANPGLCTFYKRKDDYRKERQGEWCSHFMMSATPSNRGRIIHYATYTCSECGKSNGRNTTNYCPHCGARMKGE